MAVPIIESLKIIDKEIRIVAELGSGTFGEVHLAEPIKGRKKSTFCYPERIAVKVIRKQFSTPENAGDLMKELTALQRLQHPCIVGYLGVWIEASSQSKQYGSYCLAMSFCDGGDLDHLLRQCAASKTNMAPDPLARIMTCIFAGLNYSHAHRIIHRDIKPANIMLTIDRNSATASPGGNVDRALIGDFGLARPLDKTMQMVKTRVGTPCYCSPEIVAAERYSTKTDIFSAGVMFYELMTLESPFWKKRFTDVQCFYQIVNHDPLPRFRELCKGRYSESLIQIVCQCLSKREDQRPSAFEVLTKYSSRIRRGLQEMQLPLSQDKPTVAGTAVASDVPSTKVAESSSPTDGAQRPVNTPPPRLARNNGPKPRSPFRGACPVPGPAPGPVVTTAVGQRKVPAARLLEVMESEFRTPHDGELSEALSGNTELYLLLKVLIATRGTNAVNRLTAAAPSDLTLATAIKTLIVSLGTMENVQAARRIVEVVQSSVTDSPTTA